ncbi:MAG TPA: hypothetical protein VNC60_07105 [Actinomycetota bacterium]|nr:hypothetical protein [Actinomycetota bacterium]
MRRHPVLVVLLSAIVVWATTAEAAASLHASAPGPDVATLDARIVKAQTRIDRWYPRIERWYRHIRLAAATVDRLEAIVAVTPDAHVRAGPAGLSRRGAPSLRLAEAQRALRSRLRSSWARHVQQELDTWTAYLAELVRARDRALRAPGDEEVSAPTSADTASPLTYEGWASAFLGRLGVPACDENLLVVVAWETAESTAASFNPLATTRDMPDATDLNTVGVKRYASLSQGLDASRDTLVLGAESYGYEATSTRWARAGAQRSRPGRSMLPPGAGAAWVAPTSPGCCRSCALPTPRTL